MTGGFWVFGYGSLMWKPGFPFVERQTAVLAGHRRSFCLKSFRFRGTAAFPGLVLALEPKNGAVCHGVAYRVDAANAGATRAYLFDREMERDSYYERFENLTLSDNRRVRALCYVINPGNSDYLPGLSPDERAGIIAKAVGPSGSNRDYLFNTLKDLETLGLEDSEVETIAAKVRALL